MSDIHVGRVTFDDNVKEGINFGWELLPFDKIKTVVVVVLCFMLCDHTAAVPR